jgi:hypothetical protein
MQVASRVKEDIEQRKRALTWWGNQQKKVVIDFWSIAFFSPRGACPLHLYINFYFSLLIER